MESRIIGTSAEEQIGHLSSVSTSFPFWVLDLSLTKSHAVVGATEPHPKGIRPLSSMQHPSQYSRVKSQKIVERTVWQRAIPSAPEGHSVPFVGFSIPILLRESLSNIYIDSVKREGFGLYYKSERGHPDVGLVSLSILLRWGNYLTSISFCGGYWTSLYPHCCSNIWTVLLIGKRTSGSAIFSAVIEHCI